MFKRIVWLSIFLAVSAFAAQVVVKSGVLKPNDIAIVGENHWDKLANATTQTTQALWNSTKAFIKSASFLVSDAPIQSLAAELAGHDPSVGSTPGQGGVSGGSASYSIPIALPPGRKGMQPNISLSYSSKGGNGVAGMGWNVSGLSSLHRCPMTVEQDGQARAVDYSMNDRLCFDGQRLVATAGTYGAINTKYSTEIDSFARITQLGGDLNAVNSYFKVEYKSGEIAYFGGNNTAANNARVIAGGLTKPLNWLIARTEDRLGNNIVYTYTNFTNGEVQPAAIFYTGFNTTQGDRKVEFSYETRPTSNGANDQSSSYLAGGLTRQTQRLTKIATKAGAELVREYYLNYGTTLSATSGRSLLRSVQECAWVGTTPACRRPMTFAWTEGANSFSRKKIILPATMSAIPASTNYSYRNDLRSLGDFDGDGIQEMYYKRPSATVAGLDDQYLISYGADRLVRNTLPINGEWYLESDHTLINDFDQDGKSDLFGRAANGNYAIYFWDGPNTASTFNTAFTRVWDTGIAPSTTFAGGANNTSFLDVDGDGRTDLVTTELNSSGAANCKAKLRIYQNVKNISSANRPASFPLLTETCLAATTLTGFPSFWIYEQVKKTTDLNGDGLIDFIISKSYSTQSQDIPPGRILYGQRNGSYSLVSQNYAALFPATDPLSSEEDSENLFRLWLDINGDGLDDYLYATRAGKWAMRVNTGKGFANRVSFSNNNNGIEKCGRAGNQACIGGAYSPWYAGKIRPFDTDADGRIELLIPRAFASRVCAQHTQIGGGGGTSPLRAAAPSTFASVPAANAVQPPILPDVSILCPEDPLTGNSEINGYAGFAADQNYDGLLDDLNADGLINTQDKYLSDNTYGMYWFGLDSIYDSSSYRMNALRIVETGPNQYVMMEATTPVIDGPTVPNLSISTDLYGDGLTDAPTKGACVNGYPWFCLIPIADSTGAAYSTTISPLTFPNNQPIFSNEVYVNENLGPSAVLNTDSKTPKSPDTIASITDGLGNQIQWTYYPLSSKANRNLPTDTPLYTLPSDPALRYVDARHTYFTSSMQVVAEMRQTNAIGGLNTTRYAYSEAMYNTQGRGFQGFRKIIEEDIVSGLRTTTTFSQKYPLTSLVEQVVVNPISRVGETGPISRTTNKWRCNRLDRNDTAACSITPGTNPVRFVYQSYTQSVSFDLNTSLAGLPDKVTAYTADYNHDTTACDGGTIALAAGLDAYGNSTAKTNFVSDFSDGTPGYKNYIALSCNRTRNTFAAADTTNWWLDKLSNTETRNEILHGADQLLPAGASNPVYTTNTAYAWNTNRTLASETFQNTIANQQKVTAYTYPAAASNYGLPLSVKVTAAGDQNTGGRTTSTTYSADGYFPLSVTNALGHTATTVVRLRDGLPISVTDPNGLRTINEYDAFGFTTRIKYRGALDSQYLAPDKQFAMGWCVGNNCWRPEIPYYSYEVQDGSPTIVNLYWPSGQVYVNHKRNKDGVWELKAWHYDARGLPQDESDPWLAGETDVRYTYYRDYDALGRLGYKHRLKENSTTEHLVTDYIYNGRTTNIVVYETDNPYGPKRLNLSRTTDSTGRYVETTDALGGITKFWFDANGQAAVLQDVKGSQIKATYNAIGQRSSVNDPNQGNSSFTYNALGEVITQTDARNITNTSTYDKLGRKTRHHAAFDFFQSGTLSNMIDTWSYDPIAAKGALSQQKRMLDSLMIFTEDFTYDTLVRPISSVQSHHTGGTPLVGVTNTAYDSYYGRVLTQQLASGEWLWHRYSQYGHPILDSDGNSGQMYKELVSTNAYGSPTSERWGNLLTRNTTYWPNNQVKQITYQKSGSTIRQLNYAYDVFGNVSTQELNQGMAGNTLESFSYDALHRLTQSTRTGAANSTVSYGYDAAGNFTFKSDFSQNSLSAYGYSGTTGGPNAVKSVLLKNGSTRSYNYDAAGNLVSDNQGFNSRYDHTNRPLHAARSGVISNFGYTPDGTRFKETGTEQRHNFPGVEKNIAPVASVKTYLGDYAYVNTDSANNRSIKYLLTDRLGSVDAVTDGDGNLIETRGYDAFGAPRTGTWADSSSNNLPSQLNTPKGFTQHQHIAQLGLIHMNGRTYDPGLGRFLGVDPFIQMPTNSQSLNPYSYIMNNPLSGTDPTGYLAVCDTFIVCSMDQIFDKEFNKPINISSGGNGSKLQGAKVVGNTKPSGDGGKIKAEDKLAENGVSKKEIEKIKAGCAGFSPADRCITNERLFGIVETGVAAGTNNTGSSDEMNPSLVGKISFNEKGGMVLTQVYRYENISPVQMNEEAQSIEKTWGVRKGVVDLRLATEGEQVDLTFHGATNREMADKSKLCDCMAGPFIGGINPPKEKDDIYLNLETPFKSGKTADHEFGHHLGLSHRSCGIMDYNCSPGTVRKQDLEDVRKLYIKEKK